jgi:hypothetical protein
MTGLSLASEPSSKTLRLVVNLLPYPRWEALEDCGTTRLGDATGGEGAEPEEAEGLPPEEDDPAPPNTEKKEVGGGERVSHRQESD